MFDEVLHTQTLFKTYKFNDVFKLCYLTLGLLMLFIHDALKFHIGYLCIKVPMPAYRFPSFVKPYG